MIEKAVVDSEPTVPQLSLSEREQHDKGGGRKLVRSCSTML